MSRKNTCGRCKQKKIIDQCRKKKPSKHQLKIVSTEKEPWWMSTKTNLSQFLSQNTLGDLNKKQN